MRTKDRGGVETVGGVGSETGSVKTKVDDQCRCQPQPGLQG